MNKKKWIFLLVIIIIIVFSFDISKIFSSVISYKANANNKIAVSVAQIPVQPVTPLDPTSQHHSF